ncbi:xaa-Pro aminopeptidase 3 isoform X2 [Amia ocellicauda]|uniref:xaa-Pro aminopeptidase 3 isoform X2 n=1 Tax=Amia ocellicauda TaxID=2972642 RepID=UPI003463948A
MIPMCQKRLARAAAQLLSAVTLRIRGEVTPGLSQQEFELRRHKLMALVAQRSHGNPHPPAGKQGSPDSQGDVVIVLSHHTCYMTNDIPYPFHQNPDFLYLTGCLEPDSALVLCPNPGHAPDHSALLFVAPRDPARELWDGPRSGLDGAAALTGVDQVYPTQELGRVLLGLQGCTVWYDSAQVAHPQLHQEHVLPLLEAGGRTRPLRPLTHSLRAVKSAAEVALMREAGRVTAQAFKKTMSCSRANIDESFLFAKFDFECRAGGGNFLAYPPVVAGGNRANTLHYVSNNQIIKDGEMVLLDGGCEYFGYVSDVTRTWPVNGRFSPPQVELYEAVLEVQRACVSLCAPGVSLDNIYSHMLRLLGAKLKELGIVGKRANEADMHRAARHYCPHHVGHYLGMDVHDTPALSRAQPLQPGMAITIEPGLYVPEGDSDAPVWFRGLGVRIEDDVVIQGGTGEGEALVLSADTPKDIEDIERVCSETLH